LKGNYSIYCSPLAPLGENAAVKPELLFPFAPLRENKEFKTDAPSGHGLTAALYEYENDN
jgi:hypothetical protein